MKKLLKGLLVYSLNMSLFLTGNFCLTEVLCGRMEVNPFLLLVIWLLWGVTSWFIVVALADYKGETEHKTFGKFEEKLLSELEHRLHCSVGGNFEAKKGFEENYGRFIIYLGRASSGEAHIITKEGEKNIPFENMLNYSHVGWPGEKNAEYLAQLEARVAVRRD